MLNNSSSDLLFSMIPLTEYRKKVAKERMDNPDALIAKYKEILAAAEKLAKKEQSHAEIEIQAKVI